MVTNSSSEPVLVVSVETQSVVVESDPRRILLNRIASSPAFQKSNRLRELLLFVGEHSISNGDSHLREQDIGVGVFGRKENYDTSQDTLVRVQASQLRKKLQQYFEEDGRDELLVIDMPKGSYALVFHPREPVTASVPLETSVTTSSSDRRNLFVAAGVAAVFVVVCLGLVIQNSSLRRRAEFSMGSKPTVDKLWRQIFDNGQHSYLVVADGNLVVFEDAIKQHISLPDYQNKEFRRLAEQRIEDPAIRALVLNVVNRNNTSMADVSVLRRFSLLFASNALQFDVINAREATLNQVSAHSNSILMGSRRANPWVSLYEDRLNFQTVFEESPKVAYFVNRAPQPGEQAEYRGLWAKGGFCRVAFLPSAKGSGRVLLISGTDIQSTEAGGEFLTNEDSIRQLQESFGLAGSQPMPYFEVLLQTQLLNTTVTKFHIVAKRRN